MMFTTTFVVAPVSQSTVHIPHQFPKLANHRPVVAIIDTGVDVHHPLIRESLWTNDGETGVDEWGQNKATNGIDDDMNGFIDDVHGWNFVNNTAKIQDFHGHGTHIAGIVAGQSTNFQNIEASSSQARLMILKYYDEGASSLQNLKASNRAIQYAIQMGAQIINYSGGGVNQSFEELQSLKKAQAKGILFVAAAGNEKSNLDRGSFYPASYALSNMITVAALKDEHHLLESSNYGPDSVDIAAPGSEIVSAAPENGIALMSGTSQATAFVSFLAANHWSKDGNLKANQVKDRILKTGRRLGVLGNKVRSERMASMLDQ